MIRSRELPVGPAHERMVTTIEQTPAYKGGAPATVVYTWHGEYDPEANVWTWHPVLKDRVQDGCGGGHPNPQAVRDGHARSLRSEFSFEDATHRIHPSCPLYCEPCDGRLA